MDGEKHYNLELRNAVRLLKRNRLIESDKEIAERLNYSKGTVSSYLSGSIKASKSFEDAFENEFGVSLKSSGTFKAGTRTDRSGDINETVVLGEGTRQITIDDYIKKIEEHNMFLQRIIESGLVDLKRTLDVNFDKMQEAQEVAIIYQKAWVEKLARQQGAGDPEKMQAEREEMGTIIAELSMSGGNTGKRNENS